MSPAQRVSRIATILGVVASVATIATNQSLRGRISALLGTNKAGGIWRLAAVILAIANLKNFPMTWHVSTQFLLFSSTTASIETDN
jgi:hypothetical protein